MAKRVTPFPQQVFARGIRLLGHRGAPCAAGPEGGSGGHGGWA